MTSSGLIYDSSWNRSSGTVWVDLPAAISSLPPVPESLGRIVSQKVSSPAPVSGRLRLAANLMILLGSAGLLLTMLPVAAVEVQYAYKSYMSYKTDKTYPPPDTGVSLGDLLGPINQMQAFSVNIPKISAQSVVIPNVDASDSKIYAEALKNGIAHALGTGLPGVQSDISRTIYLFAHSTSAPSLVARYNAQFYLLHKLAVGDEINLTFWAKNYKYRVAEIKITAPGDVSFLTPQTDKEILVLATCWPPGTTFKRLLILAEREN